MRKRKATALFLALCMLSACGKTETTQPDNTELIAFRDKIDSFCSSIAETDRLMNGIDPETEGDLSELLSYLDSQKDAYRDFAELDFPKEYDYLEGIADEASQYMDTAVTSFHDVYTNESYTEAMIDAQYEYASENYARAYKRLVIIVDVLNGKENPNITITKQKTSGADE